MHPRESLSYADAHGYGWACGHPSLMAELNHGDPKIVVCSGAKLMILGCIAAIAYAESKLLDRGREEGTRFVTNQLIDLDIPSLKMIFFTSFGAFVLYLSNRFFKKRAFFFV